MDDTLQMQINECNRLDAFLAHRKKVLAELEKKIGDKDFKGKDRPYPRKYVLDFTIPFVTDSDNDNQYSVQRSFIVDKNCKRFDVKHIGFTPMALISTAANDQGFVSLAGNATAGLSQNNDAMLVQIRDTGSNRSWSNAPLHPMQLLNRVFENLRIAPTPLLPGTQVFLYAQGDASAFNSTLATNFGTPTALRFCFEFVGVQYP